MTNTKINLENIMRRPSTIIGHLKPTHLAEGIASMMDAYEDDITENHKAELTIEITDGLKVLFNTVGYHDAVEYVEEADMFPINHRKVWRNYMRKLEMER